MPDRATHPVARNLFRATLPKQERGTEARRAHDFYPTVQPEPVRALLAADWERIAPGPVWEPACGDGAMVREIRAHGLPCCASDLIDRGCPDSWTADFYTCMKSRGPVIITNPPYNEINARNGHGRWLRHTLDMPGWRYCALLLNWDWPAAVANGLGALLDEHPFSWVYALRWKVDFTGEGHPPHRHGWFVWDREHTGPSEFRFLNKLDRRQSEMFTGADA